MGGWRNEERKKEWEHMCSVRKLRAGRSAAGSVRKFILHETHGALNAAPRRGHHLLPDEKRKEEDIGKSRASWGEGKGTSKVRKDGGSRKEKEGEEGERSKGERGHRIVLA